MADDKATPFYKKKSFLIVGGIIVLAIIGGATGGSKSSNSATNNSTATSPTSASPESNPLNTSDNQGACDVASYTFGADDGTGSTLDLYTKHAATDAQAEHALDDLGGKFLDQSSVASGAIQTDLNTAGLAFKQAEVAMTNNDASTFTTSLTTALTTTNKLAAECKGIGHW